jgi:hypothetical protein
MPEQTETLTQKPEDVVVEDKGNDSGTESESDESIPELEDTGAGGAGEGAGTNPVAAAAGLNEELVSKAKQSRGEKKARKIMSKLGLRQVYIIYNHSQEMFGISQCFSIGFRSPISFVKLDSVYKAFYF